MIDRANPKVPTGQQEDVACDRRYRFELPGGLTTRALWKLLCNGVDEIRDIPTDRWDSDRYYSPDPQPPERRSCRRAGCLDRIDTLDAEFFGIARARWGSPSAQASSATRCSSGRTRQSLPGGPSGTITAWRGSGITASSTPWSCRPPGTCRVRAGCVEMASSATAELTGKRCVFERVAFERPYVLTDGEPTVTRRLLTRRSRRSGSTPPDPR